MKRGSGMLRRALVVGALCAVTAAVGSVAWAVTSASDKFVACAMKSNGALRLVAAAKDCRKSERAVTWNASGQPGPRGPAGARGLAGEDGVDGLDGDDGDDGDDGLDGEDGVDGEDGAPGPASEPKWLYVFADASVPLGTSPVTLGPCPSQVPQAVNGGYQPGTTPVASVHVTASAPVGALTTASQWQVQFENTSGSTQMVKTWVLCATGTAG